MKLFLLSPLFFFMLSCLTVPEIYLNNNVIYWREYVANKSASDIYQNIYRFDKNADMDYIVYGYKSKIKYKLFLMKESNEAFYYKNVTLKTYIIESLPSFNLYEDALNKKDYSTLYMNNYFNRTTFSDTSIYLPIGLAFKDGNLYIAKTYGEDYKDRLSHWLRKNGYGIGKEWIPAINVDWNSYPVPTEHEIDWNELEIIGKLF
ncbi:hypothetical protein OFR41_01165 [Brachyspira hyodysenteriae]|uniref:hypothetical protein n=1 Tax=Brachyspira hyodysenteriae TaxID=159 RepID=UPI0022CD5F1C|nr:hypothetical protein [Brachyspira hyodysenteriae]MDA0033757.1 hypothetical protein [Brachyspira hyodysenteriae]MDA0047825.1 hypothetical protein [Brachyspira hyodysenteriae]MDA1467543.1 hypothetical protein [Brachyspira hyodysenteriae]